MKLTKIIFAISLWLPALANAGECRSMDMPGPLRELIQNEKYSDAEVMAKEALAKAPDALRANQVLANVYINSAVRQGMNIDTTALGFKPGESGARNITTEQLKAATSTRTFVDPEYRRKAEKHINALLERWPDQVDYYYCLTKIQFYAGDHENFIRYLDLTAKSHSRQEKEAIDFLVGYGLDYVQADRPRDAGDVYETLLKTFPRSAPALSSLGVTWLKRGSTEKAASYFDKAYQADAQDIIVLGNVAEVAMLRGEFVKAEKFYKRKLALQKGNQTATYFDLAMIAMYRGPRASLPYWDQYFARNKSDPDDAWWSEAAKVVHKSAKENKLDDQGQLELAVQMIEARAPKYAVPLMFSMKKKHPRNPVYTYVLAQAYDTGGYYDLAERAIVDTLARKKQDSESLTASVSQIRYNHSRFLYQLDRKEDALQALADVAPSDATYPSALYMYALIARDHGQKDKARDYLKQCIAKAAANPVKTNCESLLSGLEK